MLIAIITPKSQWLIQKKVHPSVTIQYNQLVSTASLPNEDSGVLCSRVASPLSKASDSLAGLAVPSRKTKDPRVGHHSRGVTPSLREELAHLAFMPLAP